MTRHIGEPPWTLKGDMLMDARGTHLFRLIEQPGLGRHGEEILGQIIAAPELLDAALMALPYVEDALDDPALKKGVVKRHAQQIRTLVERIDAN